jgi:hypothetical protein
MTIDQQRLRDLELNVLGMLQALGALTIAVDSLYRLFENHEANVEPASVTLH